MSPVFATRRRAEQFAAAVDGSSARGAYDGHDELLDLVGLLRDVPQAEPRAEFVSALRARLVAEAAASPAPGLAAAEADRLRLRRVDPGRVRHPRERRLSLALGGLALVGATATLAVVAQTALPGDTLYPLKRGIETAQTEFSVGDGNKGASMLASAAERLAEVQALDPNDQPTEIADTLDDFTEQATEASDLLIAQYQQDGKNASVDQLQAFTAASMKTLAGVEDSVPPAAQDEWVHAVTTLVRIDDEAKLTCPSCAGTDLDAITPVLPTAGTGFGTGTLPAINLPDVLPGLVLPSVDASGLPPGSVTKPSPTGGPGAGPTGLPTSLPTLLPTGVPTILPTGGPTTGLPTGVPTAGTTTGPPIVLPTADITQILDALTSGPSQLPLPLPSVDVTQLLGGVTSILPTQLSSPLGGLLGPLTGGGASGSP